MAVLEKYRDEEQSERDKKKKEQETSKTPPASAEISQGPLLLHNSESPMSCIDRIDLFGLFILFFFSISKSHFIGTCMYS